MSVMVRQASAPTGSRTGHESLWCLRELRQNADGNPENLDRRKSLNVWRTGGVKSNAVRDRIRGRLRYSTAGAGATTITGGSGNGRTLWRQQSYASSMEERYKGARAVVQFRHMDDNGNLTKQFWRQRQDVISVSFSE